MTKEARQYVLESLCERLRQNGWPRPVGEQTLIGQSTEYPGVDEHSVEYQLTSLKRAGYVHELADRTVCLHPSGVDEYESLTGERVRADEFLAEVLTILAERDRPDGPGVARTHLLRETGAGEEPLDRAIWFLEERGDVTTVSGRDKSFLTARITDAGRRRLE